MSTYELAILGTPTPEQLAQLETCVSAAVAPFGLRLGEAVGWRVLPKEFNPAQTCSAAVVCFCSEGMETALLEQVLVRSLPILPVVSSLQRVGTEVAACLRRFNCLAWDEAGAQRVATALLECAGLLPRQRRVFLSYRRDEARQAALQLFDAFSARQFDVFLDTHGVPPAQDFQAMLWHRLCDADVLVMLDTPGYFNSRWTSAEFGRALAKGISVLRVGWPDATPSIRTATASRAELLESEIEARNGRLAATAVERICHQLEQVRSESHAVRHLNLIGNIRAAVTAIGGQFLGVGPHKAILLELPDGRLLTTFPSVGVPTSISLHDARRHTTNDSVAVVYDSVGLLPEWQQHLDWLGDHVRTVQWVKAAEVAWDLADWEDAR